MKTEEEKILECNAQRNPGDCSFSGIYKRSVRKRLNPLLEQGRIAMTEPEKQDMDGGTLTRNGVRVYKSFSFCLEPNDKELTPDPK